MTPCTWATATAPSTWDRWRASSFVFGLIATLADLTWVTLCTISAESGTCLESVKTTTILFTCRHAWLTNLTSPLLPCDFIALDKPTSHCSLLYFWSFWRFSMHSHNVNNQNGLYIHEQPRTKIREAQQEEEVCREHDFWSIWVTHGSM